MSISIFAGLPAYKKSNLLDYPHIVRGSSMIRGIQVAEFLGAKFNPKSGWEDDVCIYVKPNSLAKVRDGDWVDIVDGRGLVPLLQARPKVKVIAVSECSLAEYRGKGMENEAVIIHPHHCNFGRIRRDRRRVRTVGYIGSEIAFAYPLEEMKKLVNDLQLNFIWSTNYKSREEVVDFYRRIDVQVVWASARYRKQSIGPTKAVNAGSFGIPTIAYPQVCYGEIEGNYIKAETMDDVARELERFRDDADYYAAWASKVDWTEPYHIAHRAELYRSLK